MGRIVASAAVVAAVTAVLAAWDGQVGRSSADRTAADVERAALLRARVRARAQARRERVRAATRRRAEKRRRALLVAKRERGVYAGATSTRVSKALAGIRERVYVPNTLDNTLTVIDPRSLRVVARFRAGVLPHHVTPSWDLRTLYVNNTAENSLVAVNPRTGRAVRRIPVRDPYNLYFTPDGKRAIVVAERYQRLDFRNPRTWRLIKSVPIPGSGVDHLDFSADGRYLLASDEFSGDLVKVDTVRMRVLGVLHVGGLPVDVKLAPDRSVFYVANQGVGGVALIDPRPFRQVKFLRTGAGAHGLAVSRDGKRLFVSNRLAGSISVIDFAKRRVVSTWTVGGSPDMLQVSPNGRQLWVSNRYGSTVSVIATATGRLIRTIWVGAGPHGLAYFPQPGRFSVGHNGVYR
ncbi:MAG: beta-propeller fold lactonase family protein [Actinomycetota bacterium]|nr:beta-propeller fold lactonase family protein [Actinomycetota bacterium]